MPEITRREGQGGRWDYLQHRNAAHRQEEYGAAHNLLLVKDVRRTAKVG